MQLCGKSRRMARGRERGEGIDMQYILSPGDFRRGSF